MNLITPSFEIWEQSPGLDGIYKQIERAGRVCYKSEDKTTDTSTKPFVNRMIAAQHYAMLEHGTVYLNVPCQVYKLDMHEKYKYNKYSVHKVWDGICYITTNLRVIVENHWEDDLKYLTENPTEYHEKRHTIHFTSDIHFYKDLTRHRVMSWAIESTRYCNYFKEKFGMSVCFAEPCWLNPEEKDEFMKDCETLEQIYFKWIEKGWQPQQAAYFLCQGTKADAIMTGFEHDFQHLFDLRALGTTGAPHPTVKELVYPLMEKFIELGYYKN